MSAASVQSPWRPADEPGMTTKPKRPTVRRNPEKRRLQNMQAQKRYRENLKKRLEHLETIAASVQDLSTRSLTRLIAPSTDAPTPKLDQIPGLDDTTSTTSPSSISTPSEPDDYSRAAPPWAGAIADVDYSGISAAGLLSPSPLSPTSSSKVEQVSNVKQHASSIQLGKSTVSLQSQQPATTVPAWPSALGDIDFSDVGMSDLLSFNPIPDVLDDHAPAAYEIPPSLAMIAVDADWEPLDCGCSVPHIELKLTQPRTFRDRQTPESALSLTTMKIHAGGLQMQRKCIAVAIMTNSMQIGISQDMICLEKSMSPFYRQMSVRMPSNDRESLVRSIQNIFSMLKPDLRPTEEQITIPHHPFVDVLPFPTFRANVIRNHRTVDFDTLFHDTIRGLMFWSGSSTTGMTWDHRCWEARPWFLQKYWALLGGDDGEIVRQSEWYRTMRGEQADPWLAI